MVIIWWTPCFSRAARWVAAKSGVPAKTSRREEGSLILRVASAWPAFPSAGEFADASDWTDGRQTACRPGGPPRAGCTPPAALPAHAQRECRRDPGPGRECSEGAQIG